MAIDILIFVGGFVAGVIFRGPILTWLQKPKRSA